MKEGMIGGAIDRITGEGISGNVRRGYVLYECGQVTGYRVLEFREGQSYSLR
jgi:hypothetical protein